jgi:pimeloyl-ACP methyl ester carboxylesterase
VLVPGLGLSGDALTPLARALDGFDVTIGRITAYGRPVRRGDAVTPTDLARQLLAQLPSAGHEGMVLVGHSSSCQVVAEAAAADPRRILGLVLIGPTTDPRAASWPMLAQRWLRSAVWERPWQVPLLVRDYVTAGVPGLLRTMDVARRHRIQEPLASLSCPVLVVRGRRDRIAPAAWTRELAGVAVGGSSTTLDVGGHMVPLTHPRLIAELLRKLLPSWEGSLEDRQPDG